MTDDEAFMNELFIKRLREKWKANKSALLGKAVKLFF